MNQKGISLIEILIASSLSLLIISMAMTAYLSIKQSYRWHQALSQIQSAGRLATQMISKDIRNAGVKGELPAQIKDRMIAHTDYLRLTIGTSNKQSIVYFIDKSGFKNQRKKPIYELNRKDLAASPHLQDGVLLGVSNMKIYYGVLQKHKLEFVPADDVRNWQRIKTVEINLLLDSIVPVYQKPRGYKFVGKSYQATDLQLHKQWTFLVTIRA